MKNRAILMASALAVAGLLTLNSAVFASGTDTKASGDVSRKPALMQRFGDGKMGRFEHKGMKGGIMPRMEVKGFNAQLKELVSSGVIDQATADKMLAYQKDKQTAMKAEKEKLKNMTKEQRKAYFESQKPQDLGKHDPFSEMVDKGILTQAQADNIMKAIQAKNEAAMQKAMDNRLSKLVEKNTITQEQADKIAAYMQKQQEARRAEMEKVKSMTQADREAYFKSFKDQRVNPLAQLAKDGVLTQAQADSIAKALHQGRQHKAFPPKM